MLKPGEVILEFCWLCFQCIWTVFFSNPSTLGPPGILIPFVRFMHFLQGNLFFQDTSKQLRSVWMLLCTPQNYTRGTQEQPRGVSPA